MLAVWPGAGNGWLWIWLRGAEEIDPVTSAGAGCCLEAKGLASKRLVSELQPAALTATSAKRIKDGRIDARNATGDSMVYPLILRRDGYEWLN